MALTKDKKKEILEKLSTITGNESAVFVNFNKLAVDDATKMRQKLREEGVGYFVARKTLIGRAFGEAKITGDMPVLDGEAAIAYSDDLTAPAREIYAFHKEFDGAVSIMGGVFEGRFMDKTEMEEIATIPATPVLRGMFVNVINSPIQGLVIALSAIAEKKVA